ncbi:heterokaryon incompatibility protein-domain-containing protein [Bisporella sp. PMI_857]|nr:heterokaryon incompatibility protein-domain-containing protein [Bisporella sp. PMI_857]
MWLIDVSSITLKEFAGPNIPPYGILSHTWEGGEVSYQEMRDGAGRRKEGYNKIKMTCKLAAAHGLAYAWVDTCCIDKSSSTELTEAINSMFQWYKRAAICYVYLSDLESSADISTALKNCRWFKRGWTLQELIAPYEVDFFDQNWYPRGSKKHLLDEISTVTGINSTVLTHSSPLSSVTVATRMSWAANRETTREEDVGYCLLGIFDVNMPLLYGEGPNSFKRLQEEIIKGTCDLSIFAWKARPDLNGQHTRRYSGILAESPKEFWSCRRLIKAKESTF